MIFFLIGPCLGVLGNARNQVRFSDIQAQGIFFVWDQIISVIVWLHYCKISQLIDFPYVIAPNNLPKSCNFIEFFYHPFRRASEFRVSYNDAISETDTFEHILSVTSHNDALLAYYYLDSDNKVIFHSK